MRGNRIQFAVVREDPIVEEMLVRARGIRRALLVASGGCTALHLASVLPDLSITLFDRNADQLDHCENKRTALAEPDPRRRARRFNVGTTDRTGLNACGNFESLFRGLRLLLEDLAAPAEIIERACDGEQAARAALVESPYWPVAFDLFFSDALLRTMFGSDAVQHAPPGSYPRYFQALFERGLSRPDVRDNYFVHHVLLGRYVDRPEAWPAYLRMAPRAIAPFSMIAGVLPDVPDLHRYGLVSLSNVFDWMDASSIAQTCRDLAARVRPDTTVVIRQLNSAVDLCPYLDESFVLDEATACDLLDRDRSLFYARIWIAHRR